MSTTARPRILFVCHNHPALHPGGTEVFSHALFRALRDSRGIDAQYLACVDKLHREPLPGTLLQAIGETPDEMLLWTGHFERFMLSQTDLYGVIPEFERLLRTIRPDVVHFHHMLMIGVEAFQAVRNTLPDAAIVLTLHDYFPICANEGQMATPQGSRCLVANPDVCARCIPAAERDAFVMRKLFIQQAMSFVDRFVCPSDFLKARYEEWGLPSARMAVIRNGLAVAAPSRTAARPLSAGERRSRFAVFGNLTPTKGALVAIEAVRRLAERAPDAILTLHGSAAVQGESFQKDLAKALAASPMVDARGGYALSDLPALMAEADWVVVPSVWWENAPLVIQEAFLHGRPVICSDIGGMAEAVRDGVDGLHFRAGDARHLAAIMERALDPRLWESLAAGIVPPRRIDDAADACLALYDHVLAAKRTRVAPAAVARRGRSRKSAAPAA
jgi:glycosyltransferase involved in cell wall biosynthesis